MFVDYHVHLDKSEWSQEILKKMTQKAAVEGVDTIGIVIHTKIIRGFEPLYYHILNDGRDHKKLTFNRDLNEYINLIENAKNQGYPLKTGIEVCYSPEGENFLRQELKKYPFDYTIGSVHMIGNMHFKTAVEYYKDHNIVGMIYYGLILKAIESGLFNIIGHMENVRREGIPGLSSYPDMLDKICSALIDNDCAVEINTKWLYRHGYIVPDRDTLSYMAGRGVKFVFGSDAHHSVRIGYGRKVAEDAVMKAGCGGFSSL